MDFSPEAYILEGVKHGLIRSSDSDDVNSFKYGHLVGTRAIELYFRGRGAQCIPVVSRNLKKLCAITLEKLRSSYYNGMSVDAVVKEATNILGERVTLYQTIMEANSSKCFLSHDKTHSQPHHISRDIDVTDGKFAVYDELFEDLESSQKPRSREAILHFLELSKVPIPNLDNAIHYLIKRGLI